MAMNPKQYRDHLYSERSHPEGAAATLSPKIESRALSGLYWTLFPFIVAEYWVELKVDTLPSGIIFPTAYLLFWAFYYTYYQPGSLESKLSSPQKWDLLGIPTVLMGICIWFVKVGVVEFTEFLLVAFLPKRKPVREPKIRSKEPPAQVQQERARDELPPEIENALAIMGLRGCRSWRMIQKRYRELAKKYHPDLNPEITVIGNRFMIYDAAYRRLLGVREKYFLVP